MKQANIRPDTAVFWVVGGFALLARIEVFVALLRSPLRYFHMVPGLDMQTLLERGVWHGAENTTQYITIQRAIIATVHALNGNVHCTEAVILIQQLCGIGTALLTAYIALHLTRCRWFAAAAGILAALYAPALMYECVILQETTLSFAFTLSIGALLFAKKHRFRTKSAIGAGIALGLCSIGRPTAILWSLAAPIWAAWKSRPHWRAAILLGATLFTWCAAGWLNYQFYPNYWPFFHPQPYIKAVNQPRSAPATTPAAERAKPETRQAATEVPPSPAETSLHTTWVAKISGRIATVFMAHEIPDNLNYYFLRRYFGILEFFPGPLLVVPLALTGILLMLFSGRFLKREGLLYAPAILVLIPICSVIPTGRYRLLLYGIFCIWACYPFYFCRKNFRWRIPAAGIVFAGALLINPLTQDEFLRSSDYVAWGTASEHLKNPPDSPLECFQTAYLLSNGNQAAAVNLLTRLIPARQFNAAEQLLKDALSRPNINPSLMNYYYALLKFQQGDFAGAEEKFNLVHPQNIEKLAAKYYFFRGESKRFQKRPLEAAADYRKSLQCNPPESLKRQIEKLRDAPGNNFQ